PNNTMRGFGDAYVSKLHFTGSALSLVYSTFLGGSGADGANGIALDTAGNAYLTGFTDSSDFATVNPLPAPNNALQVGDAFVSKLNAAGNALLYSTYLGGARSDGGAAIAVDAASDAYIVGGTSSTDFPIVNPLPAPNNALQGDNDTFVSKLHFADSTLSLVYSTY